MSSDPTKTMPNTFALLNRMLWGIIIGARELQEKLIGGSLAIERLERINVLLKKEHKSTEATTATVAKWIDELQITAREYDQLHMLAQELLTILNEAPGLSTGSIIQLREEGMNAAFSIINPNKEMGI